MSGGHFEYNQYRLIEIANEIEQIIINNNVKTEFGFSYDFSEDILNEFKKAVEYLRLAEIYVQRIDWLVSGDDGDESFRRRLKEDLSELQKGE